MNERDECLLRHIMGSMKEDLKGLVLLDTSSTQSVRVNLVLLKGLLERRNLSGIFISVDRPHQYMAHLLRMHHIDLQNVVFVDVIGRSSADCKECEASVGHADAPFHIDSLPETLRDMSERDPGTARFVMIDNLATLLTYNSYSSVERFLRSLVEMTAASGAVIPLVMDREKHGLLYETARSLSGREIRCRAEDVPVDGIDGLRLAGVRRIEDFTYMGREDCGDGH